MIKKIQTFQENLIFLVLEVPTRISKKVYINKRKIRLITMEWRSRDVTGAMYTGQ